MLIFNKQYRDEEKIISALAKKIKKSKTIKGHHKINQEIYELDNLVIDLDVTTYTLSVSSNNKKIIDLNCQYDTYDRLQQVRYDWFSYLLDLARKRCIKNFEKDEKNNEKLKKGQKILKDTDKIKQRQAVLKNALDTINQL